MSVWVEFARSVRTVMLMQDPVDRLNAETREMSAKLEDHGYRLARIETIIELARQHRLGRD